MNLHKLCVCESEFGNELNVSIFFVSENCEMGLCVGVKFEGFV